LRYLLITTAFSEHGILPLTSLRRQLDYAKNRGMSIDVLVDPSQEELELAIERRYDIYISTTRNSFRSFEQCVSEPLDYNIFNVLEENGCNIFGSDYVVQSMINNKFKANERSLYPIPSSLIGRNMAKNIANVQELSCFLSYPLIVKPNNMSGSIGVSNASIVYNLQQLYHQINSLFRSIHSLNDIIIQEYYHDTNEYTVSIIKISSDEYKLSLTRFDYKREKILYTSEEKTMPLSERNIIYSIEQDSTICAFIKDAAIKMFNSFGLKYYARFDVLLKDGDLFMIEANANPVLGNSFAWEWINEKHFVKNTDELLYYLLTNAVR